MNRPSRPVVAVAFLTLAGCGPAKLDVSRTWNLEPGVAQSLEMPPQPRPQKFTIEFSTGGGMKATVLLFRAADVKSDEDLVTLPADRALGFRQGTQDSFTVEVPAQTATRLVVRGVSKPTEVMVRLTNRR